MLKKILGKIAKHKFIYFFIVVIVAIGCYYFFGTAKNGSSEITYVTTSAKKGTIVTSVSGTGQVSATKEVDVKATVSGDVTAVYVSIGQIVSRGEAIAQLATTDAQKTVRDAETALEDAQDDLEKLKEPAEELELLQAQNSLAQAEYSLQSAKSGLEEDYSNGYTSTGNIILALPNIISTLAVLNPNQWQQLNGLSYSVISDEYSEVYKEYKSANPYSDSIVLDEIFKDTYELMKNIDIAIRSLDNTSYTNTTNGYVSTVLKIIQGIEADKNSIITAEISVKAKTISLSDLESGADEEDIEKPESIIKQKENSLQDAKDALDNYTITAPFDGVIASLDVSVGDSIASISSYGTIATIMTESKVVEITLIEVDAINVKAGQTTTLTFDAIDDFSIDGEVAEIDTIGTVSQSVVSYGVSIAFSTDDERIKPGMSATAEIITDIAQDVIIIPVSAINTSNGASYVQVLDIDTPNAVQVTIGLSNDTYAEIQSGIEEGNLVITKTNTGSSSSSSGTSDNSNSSGNTQSSSIFQSVSGNGRMDGEMPSGGMGGMGPGM
jgi:HlyD family secretion protein